MNGAIQYLRILALPMLCAALVIFIIMAIGWWLDDIQRETRVAIGAFGFVLGIGMGSLYVMRNCFRLRCDLWRAFAAIFMFFAFSASSLWALYVISEIHTNHQTFSWVMVLGILACGARVMFIPVLILSIFFVVLYGVVKRFRG